MTLWLIAILSVVVYGDKKATPPAWADTALIFLLPLAFTLGLAELIYLNEPYLFAPIRELCK